MEINKIFGKLDTKKKQSKEKITKHISKKEDKRPLKHSKNQSIIPFTPRTKKANCQFLKKKFQQKSDN